MTATTNLSSHLIFRRNRSLFAVGASTVREILNLPELGPPSQQRPAIVGLVYLHGQVVPVMDIDLRLGRAPQLPYRVTDFLVILEYEGMTTGLIVSEVIDVIPLDPAHFTRADEMGKFALGVVCIDGEMVTLLDVAGLLSHSNQGREAVRNGHHNNIDAIATLSTPTLPTEFTDSDPTAQAVFKKRGRALAHQSKRTDVTTEDSLTLAIVGLNDEWIGLPIANVREFSTIRGVTSVPGCPDYVLGLMNLRGELLALMDIRPVLHLRPVEMSSQQQSVIVQSGDIRFGIAVDTVMDVITISPTAVHGVGVTAPSRLNGFIQGTVQQGDTLFSILDLDRILQEGGLIVDDSTAHVLS